MDDVWKVVEIEPEAVTVNGNNGHHANDLVPTVELVPANGLHPNGNGYDDVSPESQQTLFSWAEFMAEEPVKPKRGGCKSQPASMSMFEWALELEQQKEKDAVARRARSSNTGWEVIARSAITSHPANQSMQPFLRSRRNRPCKP